jgi:hypothetical protein
MVERRAVDSGTNQLVADLRLAHARSINQLTDWAVVTNPDSLTAAGFSFAGGAPSGKDYYLVQLPGSGTSIPAANVTGRFLEENGRASTTPIALRFKPDGSIKNLNDGSPAGTVTITVHKKNGAASDTTRHDIEVNTATSRIKVVY